MVANQELFDSALRHAITVRRFTTAEIRSILDLLEESDAELVAMLRARLQRVPLTLRSARLQALLRSVRETRGDAMRELRRRLRADMFEFSLIEHNAEKTILEGAIPVQIEFASAQLATLRAVVTTQPFQGHTLGAWFDRLAAADRHRLTGQLQLGIVQGESIDDIVRRVAGTRSRGFRDGALAITRRNAEAVVRTAVNHVSNAAREQLWEANEDIIGALQWVSTLDGRTTPICMSRDGKLTPIGGHELPEGSSALVPADARPPSHVSCRSTMIAAIDSEGFANRLPDRPMVRDIRTRRQRERNFRTDAKRRAGDDWRGMSERNRRGLIRTERNDWAERTIGQVPGKTTYQKWLGDQPAAFQVDVLGPTRARLFRQGGLKLDQYVTRSGSELTLKDLARRHPDSFLQAGLDPDEFI